MAPLNGNLELPTLSEVVRLINKIDVKFDQLAMSFVGRSEYTADKEGIAMKFQNSAEVHADLKAAISSNDAKHTRDIEILTSKFDQHAKEIQAKFEESNNQAKERLATTNKLLVAAISSGLVSIVVALVLSGLGAK